MPQIRAFRALRFDPQVVGDLGRIVCPPYDVIGPDLHRALLARHSCNVVRLELPEQQPGEQPDDRYRSAGRLLAEWRVNGAVVRDRFAAVYVYEQTYRIPGTARRRTQRGFLARLRLEDLGPGSGVLAHERTLLAPKEDRLKLLRATGVNTSPVIGIYTDGGGGVSHALAAIAVTTPDVSLADDDGVRHRLWVVPEDGPAGEHAMALLDAARRSPVTIADGHHRYETALQYRDERLANRTGESDPPWDYILMLFLEAGRQKLTVLPTHRVVLELGEDGVSDLLDHAGWFFDVAPVSNRAELEAAFASPEAVPGGGRRIGVWTRRGGAVLRRASDAIAGPRDGVGPALARLDVTILAVALDRLCGIDAGAIAAGRLRYTKSSTEALDWVDESRDGADAAFLLDPMPAADVQAVAAEGDVMPQKSTYFYPKALTGLVMNPHEW